MRKVIAFLSVIWILAEVTMNTVFALGTSGILANTNTPAAASLVENGNVTINFTDITAQTAGKVVKQWKGKGSFVKNFVLPEGFVLKLNEAMLADAFSGSSELKKQFNAEKQKGTALGEIVEGDVELTQYPDRISVTKKTVIKIGNETEFANYRAKFGNYSADKEREKMEKKILDVMSIKCKKDATCSKGLKTDTQIHAKVAKDMVGKQEMEIEEQVDFSLIPLDIEDVKNGPDARANLGLAPKDVRITKNTILSRYAKLKVFQANTARELIENADLQLSVSGALFQDSTLNLPETAINAQIRSHEEQRQQRLEELERTLSERERQARIANARAREEARLASLPPVEQRCQRAYLTTEDSYTACVRTGNNVARTREATTRQNILNGFTLWSNYRQHWGIVVSVPWYGAVFRARESLDIGYGVGLRLPFEVTVKLPDDAILEGSGGNAMTPKIKVVPKNLGPSAYRALGLPEDHILDGKEFVFKLWANLDAKVVVAGDDWLDVENYNLLSLIGLNRIDEGKNFAPAMDNTRVELMRRNFDLPVLDYAVASLNVTLGFIAYLQGNLSANCEITNAQGGRTCDSRVTIHNANEWRNISSITPTFSGRENPPYMSNAYGESNGYRIRFDNFQYTPEIGIDVRAGASISARIPHVGRETWRLWPWTVYSFEFPLGFSLGRHADTRGYIRADGDIYSANPPARSRAKQEFDAMIERNINILSYLDAQETRPNSLVSSGSLARSGSLRVDSYLPQTQAEEDETVANFLVGRGLIRRQDTMAGYRLNETISRWEIAKLMGGLYNDFMSDDMVFNKCEGKLFEDVKGGDFCAYIEMLAEKGLLNKTNKKFRMADNVSRAEYMTMLLKASGKQVGDKSILGKLKDIPADSPHAGYIAYALQNSLFAPWAADRFAPNEPATRREVFTFITRLTSSNTLRALEAYRP